MKKMTKDKIIEWWQEKVAGEINEENERLLAQELKNNPSLAKELEELGQTWSLFEEIERPAPTAAMDARFEGMMAAYIEKKTNRPHLLDWIVAQMTKSWQAALASLFIGLLIGWWLLPSQNQRQDIQALSSEIQSMKEMMMLTLIEQPKAQERIRAVNLAAELPNADKEVINALITTLNQDENVNVRLAALESIVRYTDQAEVRQALVDALKMQDSALVMVAIADVLVQIQERSSLEIMEKLKEDVENEIVKEKLEQSILTLRQS